MGNNTKIEWCDATLNVFRGCSKVSAGCANCYALAMAARFHKPGQWGHGLTNDKCWTGDIQFMPDTLQKPFGWKKPRRIFLNSTSDTFHENVKDEWLDQIFAMVALNPQHTFIVLTKRPERMQKYFTQPELNDCIDAAQATLANKFRSASMPPDNLWLGVSVEDQDTANRRIPDLLNTPAAVRLISAEPLLGPIDLSDIDVHGLSQINVTAGTFVNHTADLAGPCPKIDWVICGGESGPNARPTHPDWVRTLRDQCAGTNTPFFFKQWGAWQCTYDRDNDDPDWQNCPRAKDNSERYVNLEGGHGFHGARVVFMKRTTKKNAGNTIDGQTHLAFPNMRRSACAATVSARRQQQHSSAPTSQNSPESHYEQRSKQT